MHDVPPMAETPPYPWRRHLWTLAPLALLTACLWAAIGGEAAVSRRLGEEWRDRSMAWQRVAMAVSRHGNYPLYAVYAWIGWRAWRRRRGERRFIVAFPAVGAATMAASEGFKFLFGRPRPGVGGDWLPMALAKGHDAFPSNHMVLTLFVLLPLVWRGVRWPWCLAAGGWLAAMGFTRLFLSRHYPSDLWGGVLLASAAAYVLWRVAPPPERGFFARGEDGD